MKQRRLLDDKMHSTPPHTIDELPRYFAPFLALAGEDRWWKRANQLSDEGRKSPFLAKILADHHWLELELSTQISAYRERRRLIASEVLPQSMAALQFAAMVVETYRCLSGTGQSNLIGRLRDGLKTGFAGLYFELDIALTLLNEGYEVSFPDFEGTASFDIQFRSPAGVNGEIECKSLSADAGRKIHRRDFYRLMDSLGREFIDRVQRSPRIVTLVTLDDRLPADVGKQSALRSAISRVLSAPQMEGVTGTGFAVEAVPYDQYLGTQSFGDQKAFYASCCDAFGANCHVAGAVTALEGCLIVMRSLREDDHSKPQLEALKKATSQLSGNRPGFVAIQFEDIEAADLALSHLRRRSALLANAVFHSKGYEQLAAVYYTAYGGLHPAGGQLAKPAFVCWNPLLQKSKEGLPFQDGIGNTEFAINLGVDPARTDPDGYVYGRET